MKYYGGQRRCATRFLARNLALTGLFLSLSVYAQLASNQATTELEAV